MSVCVSVCHTFVCPRGTNNLFVPRGQTFLTHRRGGGGQTYFVGGGGGYEDVDEEIDVSEASFLVSEASKLSAGAGP